MADPVGIEPTFSVPETDVLSIERRVLFRGRGEKVVKEIEYKIEELASFFVMLTRLVSKEEILRFTNGERKGTIRQRFLYIHYDMSTMNATEIRQSFLDFFQKKQHTIVPSASLMPQSPGLLFTNAGMNQFVPYFLGVWTPPWTPARAADTQKCIRAGGKHNDLEDVGYDTYHHTFFEMLGNWSFGDYFKKEAIQWSWELVVERWGFPAERLYATVYSPDKSKGDPGEFDQEAWDIWAELFRSRGLDPEVHIVYGNVKDNFWMMGETGPCGPCSELHVDLTPEGDTKGALVNKDSDRCIEIWNLVFIQYNAESDGTMRNLPACHVDTGMGFERACSIMQCTDGFKDFSKKPSNYATDVFRPIFDRLESLSGKKYVDVYPTPGTKRIASDDDTLQEAIAFRVIADHVRTLSFSIADGILPGNNGRNYVLRRILRRAVRYGRRLGFTKPFLAELVDTLSANFGAIFPELVNRAATVKEVLNREEASFNETLDHGLELFDTETQKEGKVSGEFAFKLYDTYGFPIDLTALLAEERGLSLDMARFDELMEAQRERARAARKSEVVRALDLKTEAATEFVGYTEDECTAKVLELSKQEDTLFIITDKTPFYAEMGGQVSDEGVIEIQGNSYQVIAVQQIGNARAHVIDDLEAPIQVGDEVRLIIDTERRRRIEAHHTATHLLHCALHQVVSTDAVQQGSYVAEDRLRFDFNSGAVNAKQLREIEEKVNAWVEQGLPVYSTERAYAEVKGNSAIAQFFGDKYGDLVRVVQVGGVENELDGVSMEFCGGTHIANTANIGLFKIRSEGAIASGVRRIEAMTGTAAKEMLRQHFEAGAMEIARTVEKIKEANYALSDMGLEEVSMPVIEGKPAITAMAANDIATVNEQLAKFDAYVELYKQTAIDAEKKVKKARAGQSAAMADSLLNEWLAEPKAILVQTVDGGGELLQELLNGLKKRQYAGAAFMVVKDTSSLLLGAFCGKEAVGAGRNAGEVLRHLASEFGAKGGGRPDMARGSAPADTDVDGMLKAVDNLFSR